MSTLVIHVQYSIIVVQGLSKVKYIHISGFALLKSSTSFNDPVAECRIVCHVFDMAYAGR